MTEEDQNLFSAEFIVLCGIIAMVFCNVAVFYSLFHYLGSIGITPARSGIITGLEPATALLLRIFIIPLFGVKNTLRLILASLVMVMAVSLAYPFTLTATSLMVLRVLHGAALVLLSSALIGLIVMFIPREKSGQSFGIISMATMVPYAIIPCITESLLVHVKKESFIYAGFSLFVLVAIIIMVKMRARIENALGYMNTALTERPVLVELQKNMKNQSVILLLTATLLAFFGHATVFYFMKDLIIQNNTGNVGIFFAVSMTCMIFVRFFISTSSGTIGKIITLVSGFTALIICFLFFSRVESYLLFYGLAFLYGFGMGIILPLINTLVISFSEPDLKGINTNLSLFIMDLSYFITPVLGGFLVSGKRGFALPFDICAVLASVSLLSVLVLFFTNRYRKERIL